MTLSHVSKVRLTQSSDFQGWRWTRSTRSWPLSMPSTNSSDHTCSHRRHERHWMTRWSCISTTIHSFLCSCRYAMTMFRCICVLIALWISRRITWRHSLQSWRIQMDPKRPWSICSWCTKPRHLFLMVILLIPWFTGTCYSLINSRTNCWRRAVCSSEQHWSLMPLHAVCSTVRPASFMYGLGAGYGGPNAMSFPQLVAHILKLTRTCWWLLLDG